MDDTQDVQQILERFRRFDGYTLGDALRRAAAGGGVLHNLKPQTADTTFVGRALTGRVWHQPFKPVPLEEYGGAQLREHAQPDDVLVLDAGGLMLSAMGDLAFTNLSRRGAAAAVINGCARDVEQLEELKLGLPVFSLGAAITSVAGNARIMDIGANLFIQGIRIARGDLIAGCRGGIVVIPWEDRQAVLEQAERIADSDRLVREGLQRGESMTQLWSKHKAF